LHEIKYDGYRVIRVVDKEAGQPRIFSKSRLDYSSRMVAITSALTGLSCVSAVIDGEAVMFDEDGRVDFFLLHAALAKGSAPAARARRLRPAPSRGRGPAKAADRGTASTAREAAASYEPHRAVF
jgi:ATP-dependent DNA ligase